jgi:hypothetical protein
MTAVDVTMSKLFELQAQFEGPKSTVTPLQFVDRVRWILDHADETEPLRCAWCLAEAIEDSEMGTTAGDGGIATTIANGHALCLEHFRRSRKGTTSNGSAPALYPPFATKRIEMPSSRCEEREGGGVQCALPLGHPGEHMTTWQIREARSQKTEGTS